jgi:ribulose-phosphate 3-epimerase
MWVCGVASRLMAEIAPSILSADFARLGEEIETVKRAGVKMIHVDVMDGHFVPNITIGPPVVRSIRAATDLFLDCHLMIENPDAFVADFVRAGAQLVSIHQEASKHLHRSLELIRGEGAKAGVVINPATPVDTLEHVLEMVDLVLVMSVNPGFGGQSFIPFALDKIRRLDELRRERGLAFRIEVDGGAGPDNVGDIVRAGCDIVVAGSSIFGTPDAGSAVELMRERIEQASLLSA